jgi:GntR family transcriptional regulator / MocR family aminotransferase
MPKLATAIDLALDGPKPDDTLWRWLYDEIRSAILTGRLTRGARVPPTRELAKHYGVSRGTVVTAFEQLHSEGYVDGKTGAGTFVNSQLPEDFLTADSGPIIDSTLRHRRRALSRLANRLPSLPETGVGPPRAFRPEPAIDEFPIALWAQIAARCMRRATRTLLADSDSRGYRPLREAVAHYLGSARGVRCTGDQVIIVAGIQHGLDLALRLLIDPDDDVCIEDPCHPIITAMFRALPARLVSVPVDDQGFDPILAERLCRRRHPKLIYVTPAHQFPLGPTMPVHRRLALLEWASRKGAWVFEDDYDSEYRYSGHPVPALQGFDRSGSVIFSGSFSKVLLPGLRLGYLVVPPMLVDKFAAARFVTDRHSSILDQAAMCEFLDGGHFGRHIRRMRELYGNRLTVLRDAMHRKLAEALSIPQADAGIQIPAWLGRGLTADAVGNAAAKRKVEAIPIRRFVVHASRPEGLLLGFAAYDARQIREGVDGLAAAIDEARRKPSSKTRSSARRSRRPPS